MCKSASLNPVALRSGIQDATILTIEISALHDDATDFMLKVCNIIGSAKRTPAP